MYNKYYAKIASLDIVVENVLSIFSIKWEREQDKNFRQSSYKSRSTP